MANRTNTEESTSSFLSRASFLSIYEGTVRCIDREDNLIHYRLSWALQMNAALAAILFIINNVSPYININASLIIISFSGMLFTFVSWLAIKAAQVQLRYLRKNLECAAEHVSVGEFDTQHVDQSDRKKNNIVAVRTGLPRPYGIQSGAGKLGDYAPWIYCWSIMLVWGGVLSYNLGAIIRTA